ncbi:MAG: amino acid ABC transporter permease [Erysipelotrichaceae bacterium]|nr:amino acid ABC transporter permease [Erysipelotrichaceae bacterium]
MKNKKKLLYTFIGIIAAIVIFFVVKDGLSYGKNTEPVDDGMVTLTIVNANPEAGDLTIFVKEGDNYTDSGLTTVDIVPGTKTKMEFTGGIKEGYEVITWATDNGGVLNIVQSAEGGDYNDVKLVKTVNEDMTVYVYCKPIDTEVHTVTFYNSSVAGKRGVVGLAYVTDGEDASDLGVIPQSRQGFRPNGYSQDLNNVTEDLEVYPKFYANIATIFEDYHSYFMHGLLLTLLLSALSVFLAMFLGVVICLIRMSDSKIFSAIASIYVEIIRGVPLLLQLLLIYVVLGPTKISLGGFFTTEVLSCILALTINSSAYSSEVFRSGIQAVDKGQMEASRALGMSKWQAYKKIVIPQGFRNALPSIVNELVQMIKETSLAVSVDASIGELMSVRKNITAVTYVNLPPYIIVAIIYFCVTFSLSKCVGALERRLSARD